MNQSARDDLDFQALMGDVQPLTRGRGRADTGRGARSPSEAQLARRESAEAELEGHGFLSDDFVDLVPPFDPLEYRRDGIQEGVVDRLRHGGYAAQARLHLLRRPLEECRRSLPPFIHEAYAHDLRSVLIVHGRSQAIDGAPNVLRSYLAKWLREFPEVQAYVSAQPADGGLGATWVMLRKSERAKAANRERQQKRRG
ncbi:DNA-nicking endonuclease, Smr domain [Halomonas shengliensis]|uniref:DNA-nicking endonuclease, Smr domain n=1 Tax=Halomonas shengliensis TaxID=419597 RepID=A0A1H0GKL9_9GAMM|nr:DNA endonuclease SmrA [Halomonas shengliensis]SDO07342.1 DNA-nicking endonuclease, Smr domain [Halomonas shengliensis]